MPLNIEKKIGKDWAEFLDLKKSEKKKLTQIGSVIDGFYIKTSQYICSPEKSLIFTAFKNCKPNDVKVVFIGNDPYPDPKDADGMCFSIKTGGNTQNDSYVNLKKLLGNSSLKFDFTSYANNGVLFINKSLTCVVDKKKLGVNLESVTYQQICKAKKKTYRNWMWFIRKVIKKLYDKDNNILFVFWGYEAKKLYNSKVLNMANNKCAMCPNHPSLGHGTGYDNFSTNDPTYGTLVKKIQNYFK